MKDKILKAIDKGLMNVLSTDIEDADIDFNNTDIDTEYVAPISLDEIYDRVGQGYINDVLCRDTRPYVSLILDDNTEISLHQYKEGMKPLFLKVCNDDMIHNGVSVMICMKNKNHYIATKMQWQKNNDPLEYIQPLLDRPMNYGYHQRVSDYINSVVKKDIDGYHNCMSILKNLKQYKSVEIPAIQYCVDKSFTNKDIEYTGYLPSAGQLYFINKYWTMIYRILVWLKQDFSSMYEYAWLSSTESSVGFTWIFGNRSYELTTYNKTLKGKVLPLFKRTN